MIFYGKHVMQEEMLLQTDQTQQDECRNSMKNTLVITSPELIAYWKNIINTATIPKRQTLTILPTSMLVLIRTFIETSKQAKNTNNSNSMSIESYELDRTQKIELINLICSQSTWRIECLESRTNYASKCIKHNENTTGRRTIQQLVISSSNLNLFRVVRIKHTAQRKNSD